MGRQSYSLVSLYSKRPPVRLFVNGKPKMIERLRPAIHFMSPKVKRILDALEEMDASEVREVSRLLQEKFGFGGPDLDGAGVPLVPITPTLMGAQRN